MSLHSLSPQPPRRKSSLDPVIVKQIIKAAILLLALTGAVVIGGVYFETQLLLFAQWTTEKLGFLGMCLILLFTDTFVTPFPPDLLLLVIAKSDLHNRWWVYVTILGFISTGAGMLGWSIGRWLGHFPWAQKMFGGMSSSQKEFVKRNGVLAVVVGALTPIPFSVTCWTAGLLKISFKATLLAALLRVPRFLLYYLLIYYSVSITDIIQF